MLPPIEPKASAVELKAFEDMLDAIVCCWVAICALQGRAIPFGDDTSAIWIPTPLASTTNATPALGK
jgi:predicted RNase H-like nuclease